jgi:hypothetical protein
LGNPWIVGILCVIAVAVAGYQFFPPLRLSVPAAAPPTTSGLPPASEAPAPVAPIPTLIPLGTNAPAFPSLIDRAYVQTHFTQWLEAPKRDPFLLATAARTNAPLASAVGQWKLKSIWRQTGVRLTAINNAVYAEGDLIDGYKVEAIESNRVWLRGPNGRESLGFAKPHPATNAPKATITPPR